MTHMATSNRAEVWFWWMTTFQMAQERPMSKNTARATKV